MPDSGMERRGGNQHHSIPNRLKIPSELDSSLIPYSATQRVPSKQEGESHEKPERGVRGV